MEGMDERYVAAVDLGSSVVRLCVACIRSDEVEMVHYGERAEQTGLLRLVWNTIEETALKVYDFINEEDEG